METKSQRITGMLPPPGGKHRYSNSIIWLTVALYFVVVLAFGFNLWSAI